MKKVVLSLALISALTVVSCDKKTDQKAESVTEASAEQLEKEADTLVKEVDSTVEKTKETIEENVKAAKEDLKSEADKLAKAGKEAVKN